MATNSTGTDITARNNCNEEHALWCEVCEKRPSAHADMTMARAFFANLAPQSVLFVQLFLAVMSVPVLFVAILIEERSAVETRLRETKKKLSENYDRARDLAVKFMNAQEDERKRIALELHDDIGQRLSLLSNALDAWETGTVRRNDQGTREAL